MIGGDIVFGGVGAEPADGALHVIELRGPAILAIMKETVVHGDGDKSGTRQKLGERAHGGFVEAGPATTVNQNDGGARMIGVARRLENIEEKRFATGGPVADVIVDGPGGRLGRCS